MDYAALGAQAANGEAQAASFYKGRVLQADADFFAYECAFLDETVNENFQKLKNHLEVKRRMAGAEFLNVHLTMGLKGGREQIATVKGYQEHRSDPTRDELKIRVRELRTMLANYKTDTITPIVNLTQEADDSLTQYQVRQRICGGEDSSVLMSGDKDLWMVEGLHCDPKTGRMYRVFGYGNCEYRDVGNKEPKLVGEGTSWFWHQMLMGDTADNIPGLPKISGRLLNEYLPTAKYNANRTSQACGEAKAVAVLDGVNNDKEAFRRVYECYTDYYRDTNNTAEMFFEQAFLLWMRRTENTLDVLNFLKMLGFNYALTENQKKALTRYEALCKLQAEREEI